MGSWVIKRFFAIFLRDISIKLLKIYVDRLRDAGWKLFLSRLSLWSQAPNNGLGLAQCCRSLVHSVRRLYLGYFSSLLIASRHGEVMRSLIHEWSRPLSLFVLFAKRTGTGDWCQAYMLGSFGFSHFATQSGWGKMLRTRIGEPAK